MGNLVRTQILFEDDVLRELKKTAKRRGTSVSGLVREKIGKKIVKKKNGAVAMLELARWARKNKITAPADLATNDDYLYGPIRNKKQ